MHFILRFFIVTILSVPVLYHKACYVNVAIFPFKKYLCICSVTKSCQLFATAWTITRQASLSFTISWSLLKFVSIELMMPSNHLILCHPFLLLPSIFPSIRVFSKELVLHIRWSKYWSFSISPSSEYSGLISFRVDWFDLLAVHGTLKCLLQHPQFEYF